MDVFEQEVAGDGPLQERYGIRTGEVYHLRQQCRYPSLAADAAMDDRAVWSLHFHVAFPEQFPVGPVLVFDLVEGDFVIDVPDVLKGLG